MIKQLLRIKFVSSSYQVLIKFLSASHIEIEENTKKRQRKEGVGTELPRSRDEPQKKPRAN
ncbi:hypothetical protein C3V43_05425 [Bacteroides heparinolyticus]|nr:hypothetical protein C3V43_05425 [Bacteroides heparinolyticus]